MTDYKKVLAEIARGQSLTLASVPDGFDAFVAADFARMMAGAAHGRAAVFVHVARDGQRARAFQEAFAFAAPDLELLDFPSWDCQPYDRVSPNAAISAKRMLVLSRLARSQSSEERPRVLSTTVNALLQRVPPQHLAELRQQQIEEFGPDPLETNPQGQVSMRATIECSE